MMKNVIFLIMAQILLVSCGSVSGLRVTATSITMGEHNGIGENSSSDSATYRIENQVAKVEIIKSSQGKNQTDAVKTGAWTIFGGKAVSGISEVSRAGLSTIENISTN